MECPLSYYLNLLLKVLTHSSDDFGGGTRKVSPATSLFNLRTKSVLRPLGGIGIRLMAETNMAPLSKMVWMMTTSSQHPWVKFLQAKYL